MACGHTKCHKKKEGSLCPGCEINIILASVSSIFGTESREEFTTMATAVKVDKQY